MSDTAGFCGKRVFNFLRNSSSEKSYLLIYKMSKSKMKVKVLLYKIILPYSPPGRNRKH